MKLLAGGFFAPLSGEMASERARGIEEPSPFGGAAAAAVATLASGGCAAVSSGPALLSASVAAGTGFSGAAASTYATARCPGAIGEEGEYRPGDRPAIEDGASEPVARLATGPAGTARAFAAISTAALRAARATRSAGAVATRTAGSAGAAGHEVLEESVGGWAENQRAEVINRAAGGGAAETTSAAAAAAALFACTHIHTHIVTGRAFSGPAESCVSIAA